ncbi:MAG: hypothetical protein HRT35_06135 [Algicola sp.]|nr:hypothetical protein [Algicola sp.]
MTVKNRKAQFMAIEKSTGNSKAKKKQNKIIEARPKTKMGLNQAMRDLVNLENNSQYLTDSRLTHWGKLISKGRKFERLAIYISVMRNLPATVGLNQGDFFEKYFNCHDYRVSKIKRIVETLMFLYCGVESFDELEDLEQLTEIGDENDHVVDCYASLIGCQGHDHALAVFEKANRFVKKNSKPGKLLKVTRTLVEDTSNSLISNASLKNEMRTGSINDYRDASLASLTEEEEPTVSSSLNDDEQIAMVKDKLKSAYSGFKKALSTRKRCDALAVQKVMKIVASLNNAVENLQKAS